MQADGRVYFMVPHLFEMSLCLRGADFDDGWFFVHVEFLIEVGGDVATLQGMSIIHSLSIPLSSVEFPRIPTGLLKRHITDEADARLAYYLRLPELEQVPPGFEPPSRPKLPPGYVDAPLVRVFNFLRMLSSLCVVDSDIHLSVQR